MVRSKKKPNAVGPFLAAALFCESVIQGDDSALSAIRIIDHLTISIPADAPEDFSSEGRKLPVSIWALLIFKSGHAQPKHDLNLVMHSPSGKSVNIVSHSLVLNPPAQGGANLRMNVGFAVSQGGLFWIDVVLDGEIITKMPIQITIQRQSAQPENVAGNKASRPKGITRTKKPSIATRPEQPASPRAKKPETDA